MLTAFLNKKYIRFFFLAGFVLTGFSIAKADSGVIDKKNSAQEQGFSKDHVLVTDFRIRNTKESSQRQVPFTFGQIFPPGVLQTTDALVARLGNKSLLPIQTDAKAKHPDGSVRHAILSGTIPLLIGNKTEKLALFKTRAAVVSNVKVTPAALTATGFSAELRIKVDGKLYKASVDRNLKLGKYGTWLNGPIVNEWLINVPLVTDDGNSHPHLNVRYSLRSYGDLSRVRVDVTVENNWAYEPGPKNLMYDAEFLINNKSVFAKLALQHYHHARWRKVFWSNESPSVDILHNSAYLIASRAVPNYDQSIKISEKMLTSWKSEWQGGKIEPMGIGIATSYMPTTGGRLDIGLLPGWAAAYIVSMDPRAKEITLGTADLGGSWSVHYRDRATDRPVSLVNHPYSAISGNATHNIDPATNKADAFASCGGNCDNPNVADTSHQPSLAYVPYLTTGDYYYLEELQFWTMYNLFHNIPEYRGGAKGLFKGDQTRAQAWSMRTLAQAAYITPDNDQLKSHFNKFLDSNLDWYIQNYIENDAANQLGVIVNGFSVGYDNNTGIAPWQDDFFTQAIGFASELGFEKARRLLTWKSRFPIGRMIGPNYCWIMAAPYSLKIRDSEKAPFYSNLGQAFEVSNDPSVRSLTCGSSEMASKLGLKVGEMTGYANTALGTPSILQPALAYSTEIGGVAAAKAWNLFNSRSVKPDYSIDPQFAIVPR